MQRYHVFGGAFYYPNGGWLDHQGAFDQLSDAVDFAQCWLRDATPLADRDWAYVVDLQDGSVVWDAQGVM